MDVLTTNLFQLTKIGRYNPTLKVQQQLVRGSQTKTKGRPEFPASHLCFPRAGRKEGRKKNKKQQQPKTPFNSIQENLDRETSCPLTYYVILVL